MLTFTVIEIAPQDGFAILRVQVGSDSPDVTTGDAFNIAATPEIAALNEVGQPLVLNTKERSDA
jgi:hypothetical protein